MKRIPDKFHSIALVLSLLLLFALAMGWVK